MCGVTEIEKIVYSSRFVRVILAQGAPGSFPASDPHKSRTLTRTNRELARRSRRDSLAHHHLRYRSRFSTTSFFEKRPTFRTFGLQRLPSLRKRQKFVLHFFDHLDRANLWRGRRGRTIQHLHSTYTALHSTYTAPTQHLYSTIRHLHSTYTALYAERERKF